MTEITSFLEVVSKMSPTHAFVLKEGRSFELNPTMFDGEAREQGLCFMNCTLMALEDPTLTYVEGYVLSYGIPIEHAWVHHQGKLVEPTIRSLKGGRPEHLSGYFGVEFSTQYVRRTIIKNGYYGILGYNCRKTLPDLLSGKSKFRPKKEAA